MHTRELVDASIGLGPTDRGIDGMDHDRGPTDNSFAFLVRDFKMDLTLVWNRLDKTRMPKTIHRLDSDSIPRRVLSTNAAAQASLPAHIHLSHSLFICVPNQFAKDSSIP